MNKLLEVIKESVIDKIDIDGIKKEHGEYLEEYSDQNTYNIDNFIRFEILEQGQRDCDHNELARLYMYKYGLMHCNAINQTIKTGDLEEALILDFGCGGGTVPLAFAYDYYLKNNRKPSINYRGFDISKSMLSVAQNLLFNKKLFDNKNKLPLKYYPGTTPVQRLIEVDNGIEPKHVLFVFSYIFSQKALNEDSIDFFIDEIEAIKDKYGSSIEYQLYYLNKDIEGVNGNYRSFIKKLEVLFTIKPTKKYAGMRWMHKTEYTANFINVFDVEKITSCYDRPAYHQILTLVPK